VSLRDQLLKKGLVDDKRAKQIDRELKEQRKKEQGDRRRQSELRAEQEAARKAEDEARLQARLAARRQAEAEREAATRTFRVRQIALAGQIRARGKQAFHHKARDGRTVLSMDVSERAAWALRAGQAAIAGIEDREGVRYLLVSAETAARLSEVDPAAVVFLVTDTHGISSPDHAFLQPDWEVGLHAHRASEAEIAALRAEGGVRPAEGGRSRRPRPPR
jgi:hypothetical protein